MLITRAAIVSAGREVPQAQQALVAAALLGAAARLQELGAQAGVFALEGLVLGANVDQLDVPACDAGDGARHRRHRRLSRRGETPKKAGGGGERAGGGALMRSAMIASSSVPATTAPSRNPLLPVMPLI